MISWPDQFWPKGPTSPLESRLLKSAVSLGLAIALNGCASISDGSTYSCGDEPSGTWKRRNAPENASELRSIAAANPVWKSKIKAPERWFESDANIMLCQSDIDRRGRGGAQWWIFDNGSSPPQLERNDGILIVG